MVELAVCELGEGGAAGRAAEGVGQAAVRRQQEAGEGFGVRLSPETRPLCPARLLFVLRERAQGLLVPLPRPLTISHSDQESNYSKNGGPLPRLPWTAPPRGHRLRGNETEPGRFLSGAGIRLSFCPECCLPGRGNAVHGQVPRPGVWPGQCSSWSCAQTRAWPGDAVHGQVPRPGPWVRFCVSADTLGVYLLSNLTQVSPRAGQDHG